MFDVEVFIEEVRKRPAIYSPNHEHYNRKEIKVPLWSEIGEIMFSNWKCLDDREKRGKLLLMQKKWKSLKDCFNRELRHRKLQQPNKIRKQYEFYNRLSFLLNKSNPEPVQQTHDLDEIIIKTETSEVLQVSNPPEVSLQEPPRTQENPQKRKAPGVAASRDTWGKEKRPDGAEDSDRLFLMSLLNDLSKLPLSTKYWVKMKFSEIMHQATMSLDGLQDVEYKEHCEDNSGSLNHPEGCYQLTLQGKQP